MSDPRDYKLDLAGTGDAGGGAGRSVGKAPVSAVPSEVAPAPAANPARPFLSVHFACCGVYQRVYRSADGRSYHGRCPRCTMPVRFVVGDGGTGARTFVVR